MSILSGIHSQARTCAHAARAVRRHSRLEAARRRQGGVVEYRSIARRSALYELIARRLESGARREPVPAALSRLRDFLSEQPPVSDHGMTARSRDERVASILVALERER